MKKVYLQPTMNVANSNMTYIIATSGYNYTGDGTEYHGGGASGTDDNEGDKTIGGTGDDGGFTLGSKLRGNRFYE